MKDNIRMMIPIVWPKGSLWRQLLVFVCFIILVSGRVVNLFVPEYTKLIGKLYFLHLECASDLLRYSHKTVR